MTLLTVVMIVVGLVGIVVPVLPGLLLVWAGVTVWALARHDTAGWTALAVATVLTMAGTLVKYLLPGRRLRSAGVGWPTLAAGAGLGVVGFFVIPIVGLFVGFALGVYLAERVRLDPRGGATAWQSTRAALTAIGWSIAIELATGLLVTTSWAVAAVLS